MANTTLIFNNGIITNYYDRYHDSVTDDGLHYVGNGCRVTVADKGNTKFYWMEVGECITQVYEIVANDWEDAKRNAFPKMDKGDILAECPAEAIKQYDKWPDYCYIDEDLCINYAKLERGTWANLGNGEYWEDRAWNFSDSPDDFIGGDGLPFRDWRTEEDKVAED